MTRCPNSTSGALNGFPFHFSYGVLPESSSLSLDRRNAACLINQGRHSWSSGILTPYLLDSASFNVLIWPWICLILDPNNPLALESYAGLSSLMMSLSWSPSFLFLPSISILKLESAWTASWVAQQWKDVPNSHDWERMSTLLNGYICPSHSWLMVTRD